MAGCLIGHGIISSVMSRKGPHGDDKNTFRFVKYRSLHLKYPDLPITSVVFIQALPDDSLLMMVYPFFKMVDSSFRSMSVTMDALWPKKGME